MRNKNIAIVALGCMCIILAIACVVLAVAYSQKIAPFGVYEVTLHDGVLTNTNQFNFDGLAVRHKFVLDGKSSIVLGEGILCKRIDFKLIARAKNAQQEVPF